MASPHRTACRVSSPDALSPAIVTTAVAVPVRRLGPLRSEPRAQPVQVRQPSLPIHHIASAEALPVYAASQSAPSAAQVPEPSARLSARASSQPVNPSCPGSPIQASSSSASLLAAVAGGSGCFPSAACYGLPPTAAATVSGSPRTPVAIARVVGSAVVTGGQGQSSLPQTSRQAQPPTSRAASPARRAASAAALHPMPAVGESALEALGSARLHTPATARSCSPPKLPKPPSGLPAATPRAPLATWRCTLQAHQHNVGSPALGSSPRMASYRAASPPPPVPIAASGGQPKGVEAETAQEVTSARAQGTPTVSSKPESARAEVSTIATSKAPQQSKRIISAPAFPGCGPTPSEPPWTLALGGRGTCQRKISGAALSKPGPEAEVVVADGQTAPLFSTPLQTREERPLSERGREADVGKVPPSWARSQCISQALQAPADAAPAMAEPRGRATGSTASGCGAPLHPRRQEQQELQLPQTKERPQASSTGGRTTTTMFLPARPKRVPLLSREADRRNREGNGPTEKWLNKAPLSHSCVSLQQKLADIRCTNEDMAHGMAQGMPRHSVCGRTTSSPCLFNLVHTEI
mmetsp:Transcript_87313/g.260491  ORF Transcript_87313/g.260491 Transcript_87313/m.260491 type:complete len:582 (+) Transcript_87313:20-1765(+)